MNPLTSSSLAQSSMNPQTNSSFPPGSTAVNPLTNSPNLLGSTINPLTSSSLGSTMHPLTLGPTSSPYSTALTPPNLTSPSSLLALLSAYFPREFSSDLFTIYSVYETPAPQLMLAAITQLELFARADPGLDLYRLYHASLSHPALQKVAELFHAYSGEIKSYNFSKLEPALLAIMLKTYLKSLSEPLIPYVYYEKFVSLLSGSNDRHIGSRLFALVQDFPAHHFSALRYLMAHLARMCALQYARGVREPPTILIQSFTFVILRPPSETFAQNSNEIHFRIIELLLMYGDWGENSNEIHFRIIELLLMYGDWGEVSFFSSSILTFYCSRTSIISTNWNRGEHTFYEYAGVAAASCIFGFYAYCKAKYDPPRRVNILIIHVRNIYSTFHSIALISWVANAMVEIHTDLIKKSLVFDELTNAFSTSNEELNNKRQAIEAFGEAANVFEEQLKLQAKLHKDARPHEVCRIEKLHKDARPHEVCRVEKLHKDARPIRAG
ncbi:uncharacterized protein LOC113468360 [Diaphorina citri]|uniref:Uncharacterized protein LOC113468360 n=1 Tax=Diaphorina citri TaxID=121845 RepID=A0A3Q0IXM6_DIACI|nr:uncharacterized protein LOC113468360 [Diaphorina citri]